MRNKILRSANDKYRYIYLLINKLSKEELSLASVTPVSHSLTGGGG